MKNVLEQLKQIWSGGTPTQRVLGVLSLLVLAAGIGGGVFFATRPDYALLYGGLDPADAASIVEEVKKAGVAAEVRGGGTAVYVASDRVDEMRMTTASKGLPKSSGSGWELFDESSFGMSDFVQNVNHLRAMQTSLGRAIERFDGVASATVQISRPKRSAFVSHDEAAKASVIVGMKSGRSLSPDNVRAVAHLISGAVEGLDPANVSVMDTRFRLLSEAGEQSLALNASNQEEYKRGVEDHLRSQAQAQLDLAGITASVRVNLVVDFQHVKQTSERYEPKGVVVSETIESTSITPSADVAKGPVSAKEQLEGQDIGRDAAAVSSESTETAKTEMKVGRTVKSEEVATPKVTRMSVSLVVHEKHKSALQSIEEFVKGAVGFDETRGDVLRSLTSAFETVAPIAEEPPEAPIWPALVERGIQVLGLLGALVLLVRLLRSLDTKGLGGAGRGAAGDLAFEGAEAGANPGEPATRRMSGGAGGGAGATERRAGSHGGAEPSLSAFVRESVKADPTAATRVLQTWLRDGDRN